MFRSSLRALCSFKSGPLQPLGPEAAAAFTALRKKAHVRCALDMSRRTVMSRVEFEVMCTTASADAGERMGADEAAAYLSALCRAGVVLEHEGHVYLRPKQVLDDVLRECKLQPFNTEHPEEQLLREQEALLLESNMSSVRLAAAENALWRRRFWAGVALASGLQMLGLSYLTFVMWGWDTMEPICYFITATTAFASYVYFIVKSKDHTYESIDTDVLFREGPPMDSLRLHANTVAALVRKASVEKAVEEAHNDLVEELLQEAAHYPTVKQ